MGSSASPCCDLGDEAGNAVFSTCGVVTGLQKSGILVQVVHCCDDRAIAEMATASGQDAIVATSSDVVTGLERKIVGWVPSLGQGEVMDRLVSKHLLTNCQ